MNMSGSSMTNPPQPHKTISCQQLLQDDVSHSGWLRKRSKIHKTLKFAVKVIPWLNNYAVLSKGCMYIFSSDTAKKPSSAFSLYGYNSVIRAGEILQQDAPWAFKLVTVDDDHERLRYFSTPSEREQKIWMAAIKKQMMFANGKGARISNRSQSINESTSFDDIEDKVYDTTSVVSIGTTDDLEDDEDYNEIDDWEPGDAQDIRNSRPLPPLPPGHAPSTPARGSRDKLPSTGGRKDPAPPPVSPGDRRPTVFPPGNTDQNKSPSHRSAAPPPVERRKPPELPVHLPDDDEQQQTPYLDHERTQEEADENLTTNHQASIAMSGTVSALKAKFNEKPQVNPKPFIAGKIKVMPDVNTIDLKKTGRLNRLPSDETPRKAAPLPTPPKPKIFQHHLSQQREVPDGTDGTDDNDGYLNEVFWNGKDKDEANRILNGIKEDGVFLVRPSETNEKVLVVYAEGGTRKYKIVNSEGKCYITSDEQFDTVKEMLDYYHKNYLPRRNTCLLAPYTRYK